MHQTEVDSVRAGSGRRLRRRSIHNSSIRGGGRRSACRRLVAGRHQRVRVCDGGRRWHHTAHPLRAVDDRLASAGQAVAAQRRGVGRGVQALADVSGVPAPLQGYWLCHRRLQEHLFLGVVPPNDGPQHRPRVRRAARVLRAARPDPALVRAHPRRPSAPRRLTGPRRLVDGQIWIGQEDCRLHRRGHPHRLALSARRPPDVRLRDLHHPPLHGARHPPAAHRECS